MTTRTRLTLLAPGLLSQVQAIGALESATNLEVLAGRGTLTRSTASAGCHAMEAWQESLLRALDIDPAEQASAPLAALGSDLGLDGASWLELTFVHLAAGLDHLVLVPLQGAHTLDVEDRAILAQHIHEDLRASGFEWIATSEHNLVRCEALDVQTCAPDSAARVPLTEAMPRGSDSTRVRRVMTELQMRLHEHPVNTARARRGLLAANSVWLWGGGRGARITPQRSWPKVFADHAFVRGVCKAAGRECHSLAHGPRAFSGAGAAIAVLPCVSFQEAEEHWFAPLKSMLNSGEIVELTLLLDDVRIDVNTASKYRFWRKPLRFDAWSSVQ